MNGKLEFIVKKLTWVKWAEKWNISWMEKEILFQASDTVKLQIQKAMRERDQANANTMQIRSDFEKLLLQSNQVSFVFDDLFWVRSWHETWTNNFLRLRMLYNCDNKLGQHRLVFMKLKMNSWVRKNNVSNYTSKSTI